MIAVARGFLRRKISPQAYQYVRSWWWHVRFYLPRLVTSGFVRRTPNVQGFPAGQTSELVHKLRNTNVAAPTQMCRVMTWHGSDKGHNHHNYTTVYSALFGELRDEPLLIFELGLGSNNTMLPLNTAVGGSLRGWRALFPHALVYGADIDRDSLFEEDRIKTFYCDQCDSVAVRDLWKHSVFQGGADIVIDDGLHTFEANASFLDGSLEHLRRGGFYVIEDINREAIKRWHNQLETIYSKRFPNHEFALVELPNKLNGWDNNLLVIHRPR